MRFLIYEQGFISDIETARDLGMGTGEEVVRVIQLMNGMKGKWIPAKLQGKPIMSEFVVTIAFKLD